MCNYSLTVTSYNGFFTNAYTNTLPDLKDVITMAEQEEAWDYWAIAKVLTAYNYHMLADLYEDIPFTEALDQENILILIMMMDVQSFIREFCHCFKKL